MKRRARPVSTVFSPRERGWSFKARPVALELWVWFSPRERGWSDVEDLAADFPEILPAWAGVVRGIGVPHGWEFTGRVRG